MILTSAITSRPKRTSTRGNQMGELNQENREEATQASNNQTSDHVGGNKTTAGDIKDSTGVAIGPGARASVTTINYLRSKPIIIALAILAIILIGLFLIPRLVPGSEQPVIVSEVEGPIEVVLPTATPTPIPSSTSAPFAPAAENEALIVILPFYITSSGSSDAHNLIYEAVEEKIQELGLENVRVEIDPNVILELSEREAAQELGESYGASMVIWGTETRTSVNVNFLNIKELHIPASDEQVQVLAPDTLVGAKFVEGHLPGQLTFLALFAIGQAISAEGKLTEAIPVMEEAVANLSEGLIAEESASADSAAAAYSRLGWLYHNSPTQDYRKARDAYEKSLTFDSTIGSTLGNLGNIYLVKEGQYEKAKDYYEQALAIARVADDYAVERAAIGNLGSVYLKLEQYEKAKDYYEQALDIAQETGDRTGEGFWLGKLGNIYLMKEGQYEKAIDNYEQALDIAQETSDRTGEGRQLGNLGRVYQGQGEYEKAIDYYEQALAIAQETGDDEGEGFWLGELGRVYQGQGEYEKAKDYYEQALDILEGTYLPLAEYYQQLLDEVTR
jgi:tetratricopeptide (TPR) repeat protein